MTKQEKEFIIKHGKQENEPVNSQYKKISLGSMVSSQSLAQKRRKQRPPNLSLFQQKDKNELINRKALFTSLVGPGSTQHVLGKPKDSQSPDYIEKKFMLKTTKVKEGQAIKVTKAEIKVPTEVNKETAVKNETIVALKASQAKFLNPKPSLHKLDVAGQEKLDAQITETGPMTILKKHHSNSHTFDGRKQPQVRESLSFEAVRPALTDNLPKIHKAAPYNIAEFFVIKYPKIEDQIIPKIEQHQAKQLICQTPVSDAYNYFQYRHEKVKPMYEVSKTIKFNSPSKPECVVSSKLTPPTENVIILTYTSELADPSYQSNDIQSININPFEEGEDIKVDAADKQDQSLPKINVIENTSQTLSERGKQRGKSMSELPDVNPALETHFTPQKKLLRPSLRAETIVGSTVSPEDNQPVNRGSKRVSFRKTTAEMLDVNKAIQQTQIENSQYMNFPKINYIQSSTVNINTPDENKSEINNTQSSHTSKKDSDTPLHDSHNGSSHNESSNLYKNLLRASVRNSEAFSQSEEYTPARLTSRFLDFKFGNLSEMNSPKLLKAKEIMKLIKLQDNIYKIVFESNKKLGYRKLTFKVFDESDNLVCKRSQMLTDLDMIIKKSLFCKVLPSFLSSNTLQSIMNLVDFGLFHFIHARMSKQNIPKIIMSQFPVSLFDDLMVEFDGQPFILLLIHLSGNIFRLLLMQIKNRKIFRVYTVDVKVVVTEFFRYFTLTGHDGVENMIIKNFLSSVSSEPSFEKIERSVFVNLKRKDKITASLISIAKRYWPKILEFKNYFKVNVCLIDITNFERENSELFMVTENPFDPNSFTIRYVKHSVNENIGMLNRIRHLHRYLNVRLFFRQRVSATPR